MTIFSALLDFDSSKIRGTLAPEDFIGFSSSYGGIIDNVNDPVFQKMMHNLFAYGKKDSIAFRLMGIPSKINWTSLARGSATFPSKFVLEIPYSVCSCLRGNVALHAPAVQ